MIQVNSDEDLKFIYLKFVHVVKQIKKKKKESKQAREREREKLNSQTPQSCCDVLTLANLIASNNGTETDYDTVTIQACGADVL